MNKDFIALLRPATALAPVIAASIGKQVAWGIECRRGHRALNCIESLQALLVILVPVVDNTVTSACRKRSVASLCDRNEGNDADEREKAFDKGHSHPLKRLHEKRSH